MDLETKLRKLQLLQKRATPEKLKDFQHKFLVSWLHHDNALEGVVYPYETLNSALRDTTLSDVSYIAAYEAINNHADAIEFVQENQQPITRKTLDKLQSCFNPASDKFRKDPPEQYFHTTIEPKQISSKIAELLKEINAKDSNPLEHAAWVHFKFMEIYPWDKTSGRIARLLMNMLLLRSGFVPAIVHNIDRQRYYETLCEGTAEVAELVTEAVEGGVDTGIRFFG